MAKKKAKKAAEAPAPAAAPEPAKAPAVREYPKWVGEVVVKNAEEEKAVLNGRAILETVVAATGNTVRLVGIR